MISPYSIETIILYFLRFVKSYPAEKRGKMSQKHDFVPQCASLHHADDHLHAESMQKRVEIQAAHQYFLRYIHSHLGG